MDNKNYDISAKEIILRRTGHKGGTETFIYEPSNIEEEPLGNLYIIGWVKYGKKEELDFIPNLIASLMRREFYRQNGESSEILFETSLKKANATLSDIASPSGRLSDTLGLCVANIAGDKIRFAQTSPVKALLYRDNGVIDISHKEQGKGRGDFFSSVVAGDIFPGDKLIFITAGVFDLFSDIGIKKLGPLSLNNQAEIINGLYQKNAAAASLNDQAAILLEIKKPRERLAIAKPIAAAGEAKNKIIKETKRIEILFNKKHKIIAGFIILFIFLSPLYLASQSRLAAARRIKLNIQEAEKISPDDKESARLLLKEAQTSLPTLLSNWYLAGDVQKISEEIDRKISSLDGIYKETPEEWARLNAGALKFSPRHIFDAPDAIYIFGSKADLARKVDKNTKSAAFIPLIADEEFMIERAFKKDDNIYLVNDSDKSAYVFYPSTDEIIKVVNTLKKTLGTPSEQNSRTAGDSVYSADNPGKIIKTTKGRARPEKFLFGSDITAIDFTLSTDAKHIYILTQSKIFAIENK